MMSIAAVLLKIQQVTLTFGFFLVSLQQLAMISITICEASSTEMSSREQKYELPNLEEVYKGHFPAIIPDLSLFLKEQANSGVSGRNGSDFHFGKRIKKRKVSGANRTRTSNIAPEGLYVLDVRSDWESPIKVGNEGGDEIHVELNTGELWTQELVKYKTSAMRLVFWLSYTKRADPTSDRCKIKSEPFGGVTCPNVSLLLRHMIRALRCPALRLSKWVFSKKLGVLAMIYAQVAKENNNMLARLLLLHLPLEQLKLCPRDVPKGRFVIWMYENPTHREPKLVHQVNLDQLRLAMKSLLPKSDNLINNETLATNGHLLHE